MSIGKSSCPQPFGPTFFTAETAFFSDRLLTDQKAAPDLSIHMRSPENSCGCG